MRTYKEDEKYYTIMWRKGETAGQVGMWENREPADLKATKLQEKGGYDAIEVVYMSNREIDDLIICDIKAYLSEHGKNLDELEVVSVESPGVSIMPDGIDGAPPEIDMIAG